MLLLFVVYGFDLIDAFIPGVIQATESVTNTISTIDIKCSVMSDINDTSVGILRHVTMGGVVSVIWEKYAFVDEMDEQIAVENKYFRDEKTLLAMNNVPYKLQYC